MAMPTPVIAAWVPGGGEIVLIALIVLVLFGSKKIPEFARGLGEAKKEFKKASREDDEPAKPVEPKKPDAPGSHGSN
jgi:sec-independent protein translocase protein TatA